MDSWDEIRTAYQVARAGTVSGAADALGVHHATVIRHIDALEDRLGVKLFQRHARGYTATEAGDDLLRVAQTTDDQFTQLAGRIRGQGAGVGGELLVTSLATLSSLLTPVLAAYQEEHPEVCVRFLTGARLFRLEYGEAHVAIRAGTEPDQPDNVVQKLAFSGIALVASDAYIAKHGMPASEADLKNHWFVGEDDDANRAPFYQWLGNTVTRDRVRFRTTDSRIVRDAILAGAGIGFIPEKELTSHKTLTKVIPSKSEWSAPLWLVTHVDLHRTAKVQSFLSFIKEHAKSWDI
ncbi:LysR family transcriptional regulator [Yoonia sp. R2331]|uniref:LysR family transcriptional regulator n=1 Tax=Yoonia sp. R2331 TaxID=3237238 RepID=UPI0034E4D5B1